MLILLEMVGKYIGKSDDINGKASKGKQRITQLKCRQRFPRVHHLHRYSPMPYVSGLTEGSPDWLGNMRQPIHVMLMILPSAAITTFSRSYSFLKEFRRIIVDEGFTLNEAKLRLQDKGQRQEVTGLVVNSKVNVCRKYIRDIENLLYIWERYGVDAAYARFLKHSMEWRKVNDGISYDTVIFRPHMVETVGGRLAYLRMVRGKDDPVWSKLNNRFMKLKEQYESRGVIGNPVRILHSWTIKRFEQLSSIELHYGDPFGYIEFLRENENPQLNRNFYIEKNGHKTYVHPSRYCKTRLMRVLEKGDLKEFERLKSEFRIGLCVMNPSKNHEHLLGLLPDDYNEAEIERMKSELQQEEQERARSLNRTFSNLDVYWKIFRRPPDIEDLPY